ncbi:MAG TPA: TetR/AcrR family transcriptional regulator [Candidatus Acidoferrum sp.]|nr:TetR/AcrR family transcriptional regulator [Candidatus Acidoferrum sp.]
MRRGRRAGRNGTAATNHRSRGRPLQISEGERRRRLIAAAERVFLDAGYGDATMDDVARKARMSKKTLYQLFPTKEQLFAAVMASRDDGLIAAIEVDDGARSPREALESFLRQAAQTLLSPQTIGLHRLVVSETRRRPELARAFHRAGAGRCKAAVLRWFALQRARGKLIVDNAEEAAGMLFGMVVGEPHMRRLLCDSRPTSKAAIDRRVKRAVDIFLKGAVAR